MKAKHAAALSQHTLDEAARWFVLLACGEASEADCARCQAWRDAHPQHEQAWQHTQAVTARFAAIPREQAQVSVEALNHRAGLKSPRRRKLLLQLAAVCTAGTVGWQGWRYSDWSADQLTAIGEQRDIDLPDGSRLRLDTDSAIDIAFDAQARLIRLRRGRILVETAYAPDSRNQPFLIETVEGRARALGTRFTVHQEAGSTQVTVLGARVALEPAGGANTVILNAGQTARFDRHTIGEPRASRPFDAAWSRRLLIADAMALKDFVAELGRYRRSPLLCDPAVQALRISGTFPLRDIDGAVEALVRTLPVQVELVHPNDPASGLILRAK